MSRFVLTAQLQLQAPNNVAQVVRQIQSQLNNVTVNVQVQGAQQAQRQIQQITQNTNNATTAAERMGRAFAVSVRRFAAFSIATRAVGLFTSTLGDAVQTAIDFERQLVKVSQVTGESVSKLSKLTSTITDLSTGLGVSSQSLLEVSTILLQAGLNSKDTEVALKSLARAALAPNFDSITETAEGAIAILAQFQEGVGSLEKQLGSINAVAGAFAVEASDLIDVIRRTGGVFKASGGDLNELLALFTSVRATTRESAESIGTGLRTIFTRIQRPQTIEFLKQFGVELVDLEGKFVGPFEAVKRLSGALAGLGEGDLTFIRVAEELGGFRQIGKVLPLLQQFSVAQSALNVAQKSGNSLAQDAATAQQALAIRITKVKEEFLALVRSVTETATFQIMANTALSLATSLIKLADSIKPLLPLLGALAAIRIARGLGSFLGGIGGGLASARTFNKGGKVHHFARGGMVPGTGNRDTVPAMLSPGEFVIRKSSVQKLGAANLAAMNENRYEDGGPMTMAQKLARARGAQKIQKTESQTKKKKFTSGRDKDELMFSVDPGNIGAFFMNKEGTPDGLKPFKQKTFDITNPKLLSLNGVNPYKSKGDKMAGKPDTFSAKGILQAGQIQTFYPSIGDIQSGSLSQIIQSNVKNKLSEAVMSVANEISSKKLLDIPPIDSNEALLSAAAQRIQSDAGAIRTTSGYLYEGVIDALTGARPASGSAVFDFPASSLRGNRSRLAALFGNQAGISKLKQADAKASYSSKIIDGDAGSGSISSKIINSINNGVLAGIKIQKKHFGGLIQKFAIGGIAQAPLIDDIANASGAMMPRPSSAIAALISAGGGAIDIDRTIKRTIGDKAYGMAKTSGQQSAVLDKFFRDPQARLRDVTSAPLTTFGKELQSAIKSGQLQPGKLSIVSKSQRVPGVAEYLSNLFGIPLGNMIFTGGGSKQPAMDALRSKGPRASRVARFATGGGVGTDTVPALLTPGEFVINRASAQNIGYGALNRMNKVGKYAKGGIVQKFSVGGMTRRPTSDASSRYSAGFIGSGGLDSSQNFIPFDMLNTQAENFAQSTQRVVQAQQQQNRSIGEAVSQNKMFAASMTVGLLQGFLPALDENSSAVTRMSHSLLNVVSTITTVGFALEAFGVALNAQVISQFISGASSLTQTIGNLSGQFSGFGRNLGGLVGRAGSIGSTAATITGNIAPNLTSMGTNLIGGFKSGLAGNKGVAGWANSKAGASWARQAAGFGGPLTNDQMLRTTPQLRLAAMKGMQNNASSVLGSSNTLALRAGSGIGNAASALKPFISNLNKLAGPAAALGVAFTAITSIADSFSNYQGQANKAIQDGNVEKAKSNAVEAAGAEAVNNLGNTIIGISAAFGPLGLAVGTASAGLLKIGSELPVVGPAIKNFAIGLGTLFGGNTLASIESLAAAQAQGVKTQKSLNDAGERVTKAMSDLEKGSISAAQAVAASSAAGNEVSKLTQMNLKAASDNEQNKSGMVGGFLRGAARVGTLGLAGYMGLESGAQRNSRIDKENKGLSEQSKKAQEDLIAKSTPAINAFSADIASAGGTFDDLLANLNDQASAAYNPGLYQALIQQGTNPLRDAFNNIKKEIEIAQKAFNAMNLGMQNVQGAAAAAAVSVTNYVSSQQSGNIPLQQSLATLEASITSAAQGISDADFTSALGDAENTLRKFGANDQQVNKFKENLKAINSVQKNSAQIFADTKDELAANIRNSTSADARRKAFTKTIGANLEAQKVDPEIIKRIKDAAGNLTDDQLKKIGEGDFSVFDAAMKELGEKTLEQVKGPLEAAIKIQEELNGLTKRRIELERNLSDAQVEALNVRMEARDIQAKYGGKAVTPEERRQNIIDIVNTQGRNISGVGGLTTGNATDIQRRSAQLAARQAELGNIRNRAAAGDQEAMRQISGQGGLQLEEEERSLAQAAKDQLAATRDLIKAKEQELQIIGEKNKLEKQSMESLITGDIEKFFEQQAAVGATAAIASGNQEAMNRFGASALATAYQDIQRQMEAGVQSIFGINLSGAGGLAEQAAQAALSARGVQSRSAAQMIAGTTPEQEAIKSEIRALAETMGPTADLQTQAADLQLQAAEMQLQAAQARGEAAVQQTEARQMARGGMVYASRGMFVPRGTDTVPAMLTPGEFVVNRRATQNNLQLLKAINNGNNVVGSKPVYANRGGKIRGGTQYLAQGGMATQSVSIDPQVVSNLASALTAFNKDLATNVANLQNTKFQIKLETANINVNFQGASFLANLREQIQQELFSQLAKELANYRVGPGGNIVKSQTVLG